MYKLIIADDEPLMRAGLLYRNDWNSMGYEVAAVLEDGKDVLEYLEKESVDVLLLDICMYQISGLDVAKTVLEKYPKMKIILLSGYKEFEYAREAMRCHVYEYLLKPVDYEKLKSVFAKLKSELDEIEHEKQLLDSFSELEYEQAVRLAKMTAGTVLGENDDVWLVYARLKNMLYGMTDSMKSYLFKEVLELLKSGLRKRNSSLASLFEEKLRNVDFSKEGKESSVLFEVLSELNDELVQQGMIPSREKVCDDSIQKACNYIRNHLGDELGQKEVAKFLNISPRHFARRFRQEMGETFTEYLFRMRMECAKKLLIEGDIDVADIPEVVGYHQEKHFQQLFKKYTGYTMREYQIKGAANHGHNGMDL